MKSDRGASSACGSADKAGEGFYTRHSAEVLSGRTDRCPLTYRARHLCDEYFHYMNHVVGNAVNEGTNNIN